MLVQPDQCRAKGRCYLLVLYTDCPTLQGLNWDLHIRYDLSIYLFFNATVKQMTTEALCW